MPNGFSPLICNRPSGERAARVQALTAAGPEISYDEILSNEDSLPDQLVDLIFALQATPSSDGADRFIDQLLTTYPNHPEARLLNANKLAVAVEPRWTEVSAALEGVNPDDLGDPARAKHYHHLRALAAMHTGRTDVVEVELAAANALEGTCMLGPLQEMVEGWHTDVAEGARTPLIELYGAIHEADACLDRGDPAGVVRVLDRPCVWAARERQSLARLAEGYLQLPPGARADRVRKLVALGALLDQLHERRPFYVHNLPMPGAWDDHRLADVAARAKGWLETLGPPAG
jgi:hypothetical protein